MACDLAAPVAASVSAAGARAPRSLPVSCVAGVLLRHEVIAAVGYWPARADPVGLLAAHSDHYADAVVVLVIGNLTNRVLGRRVAAWMRVLHAADVRIRALLAAPALEARCWVDLSTGIDRRTLGEPGAGGER